MRRLRTICILVIAALLPSVAAPQAFASWECEGRTCGTTPWSCCCVAPSSARDGKCDRSFSSTGFSSGTSACPASCNCVMVSRSSDAARPALAAWLQAPFFGAAALPRGPSFAGQLPAEVLAHVIESRGPPIRTAILSMPVLRGPPFLMFPTIGS